MIAIHASTLTNKSTSSERHPPHPPHHHPAAATAAAAPKGRAGVGVPVGLLLTCAFGSTGKKPTAASKASGVVPSTRANFRMIEGRGESLPGPPRASTSATSGSVALPLMSRRLLFPRDPDDSSLPSALGAFPWGGEAIRRRREVDSVRGFGGPWYNALRDALLPPLLLLFAVAVEVELGALSVPVLPMTALQQRHP